MNTAVLIIWLASWMSIAYCDEIINDTFVANSSDPNKDMYVIHAMVYQVGILTNKTDDGEDYMNNTGKQEAITIYNTNGTNIDLSNIPTPLLTNVTAQSMVGVAPTVQDGSPQFNWNNLTDMVKSSPRDTGDQYGIRVSRNVEVDRDEDGSKLSMLYRILEKRAVAESDVKIVKGTAIVPQEAGVSSLALPPFMSLNNNFSEIPVPIPNTSVVQYAKMNTLVHN